MRIFLWSTQLGFDFKHLRYLVYTPTVLAYYEHLSTICHFDTTIITREDPQFNVATFKQQLKELFVVPRLNNFHEAQKRINKSHLVEAFLSLLLQLIYRNTDQNVGPSGPFKDGIENLEKELRFLLTILGDISWMLLDSDELEAGFQYLLPEFEEVANQAGSFAHYFFITDDQVFKRTHKELAAVLSRIDLLKANLQSYISIPAYTTPRSSIVDSIIIVDSVVDDLEDLLKREDDPISDIKDLVNLLHHELFLSHSSIKGIRSPQPSQIEELKDPLMRIGGIAHQAEYLITSFLVKDAPLWYVINRLTCINNQIQLIRTELQLTTLKYQSESFKVEEYNFSAKPPLQDKRYTEITDITVGFEDTAMDILGQLVGGRESLQIISILGMPGLGKTTLANKLFNHPSISYWFYKIAWCVVSQTYKIQRILANILFHINSDFGKDSIFKMEEISLVEHIHKTLKGRRYLIVLDDIWDSNVLDGLLRCFPDDRNGSRILFTSRNKDVAPPNSIIHELPFLSNEQCWELLEKKVFGNRTCPSEMQGIGTEIAARCCGLPLTVVVIAGVLLVVEEEERAWEEVEGSLGSYINGENNSVMQILELSYKFLPDHLKPCFLYFGEFEEDEEITVGDLKRLWVAEGFVCKEKEKTAENIAEEYLMELINKNMVMIAERRKDGRGIKSCVVHDLKLLLSHVLFFACSYMHTVYEKNHRIRAFTEPSTLINCQHVRSYVGNELPNALYFRDMRLLRVLHFRYISYGDHYIFGVEYLVNLRFLVIYNIPTWIGRLVNLEYLRVMDKETYLPPAIVKMKKLRYLRAWDAQYGKDWNISNQANNLEYLSGVIIKTIKDEELLKCSPHLCKLKCHYDVDEDAACPHFDLHFLTQLDSLSLKGFLSNGNFEFPSNIRKLTLSWSRLPWEKMSIVGRLEFLEVLKLSDRAFVGEIWDTADGEFQKLRFLQLQNLELSEWNVASSEHFPKLQQLILKKCKRLQEIPSEIGEITTLELIKVEGDCLHTLVESAEKIKQEQVDNGNEELSLITGYIADYW